MWFWIILVFTVWIAAWQIIRRKDRRLDDSQRLAARKRVRARARIGLTSQQPETPEDSGE